MCFLATFMNPFEICLFNGLDYFLILLCCSSFFLVPHILDIILGHAICKHVLLVSKFSVDPVIVDFAVQIPLIFARFLFSMFTYVASFLLT